MPCLPEQFFYAPIRQPLSIGIKRGATATACRYVPPLGEEWDVAARAGCGVATGTWVAGWRRGRPVGRPSLRRTLGSGVALRGTIVHDGTRATHRVAPTLRHRWGRNGMVLPWRGAALCQVRGWRDRLALYRSGGEPPRTTKKLRA
jgi:hypothetical protein